MMAAIRMGKDKVLNGCTMKLQILQLLYWIAGAVVYTFYKVFISIEKYMKPKQWKHASTDLNFVIQK